MPEHVWLFLVNDTVNGVFRGESHAEKALVDFIDGEEKNYPQYVWDNIRLHRWHTPEGPYKRVEIEQRKVE